MSVDCYITVFVIEYKKLIHKLLFIAVRNVVFTSMCQEFCPQGGCVSQYALGQTSPHPLGRHPPGQTPPGQRLPLWADTPPTIATEADGTHATGMHSRLKILFYSIETKLLCVLWNSENRGS